MNGRRIGLTVTAIGAALFVLAVAKKAGATEYEIWAVRSSAAQFRDDVPNTFRIRERDEEPFASLEDCRQAIKGHRVDKLTGYRPGWRLRCAPVPVPLSRYVTR